jgi:hypothetical protein
MRPASQRSPGMLFTTPPSRPSVLAYDSSFLQVAPHVSSTCARGSARTALGQAGEQPEPFAKTQPKRTSLQHRRSAGCARERSVTRAPCSAAHGSTQPSLWPATRGPSPAACSRVRMPRRCVHMHAIQTHCTARMRSETRTHARAHAAGHLVHHEEPRGLLGDVAGRGPPGIVCTAAHRAARPPSSAVAIPSTRPHTRRGFHRRFSSDRPRKWPIPSSFRPIPCIFRCLASELWGVATGVLCS